MNDLLLDKLAQLLGIRRGNRLASSQAAEPASQKLPKHHDVQHHSLPCYSQQYQSNDAEIHCHDQGHIRLVRTEEANCHHRKAMTRKKGHHSSTQHGSHTSQQDGPHTIHS